MTGRPRRPYWIRPALFGPYAKRRDPSFRWGDVAVMVGVALITAAILKGCIS